ncbi:Uma2 family endonuclease [Phormidesmis sp. 146-12]
MVNPLPVLTTVPTDTWVEADWEDFLTFADDPTLASGRFYYDQGYMRIEMAALGSSHCQDNSIVANVVLMFGTIKNIPFKELINGSFRKVGTQEAQPDVAYYIGEFLRFPPRNNSPINLDELPPPTLVIEVAASSLQDDKERKKKLYQRMGVQEYWVVDVKASQVLAFTLSANESVPIRISQVLPGLEMTIVEEALRRSQTEDNGAIGRWLIASFSQ